MGGVVLLGPQVGPWVAGRLDEFGGQLATTGAVITEAMHFVSMSVDGARLLAEFVSTSGTEVYDLCRPPELVAAASLMEKYADPKALSFAESLRAVRRSLQHLHYRPEHVSDFKTLLREATLDDYERTGSKSARYKPQKKDKPSCGLPKVTRATSKHREKLKLLNLQNAV